MENPSPDKDKPPDRMDRNNALKHLTDMFSKVMNVESIAEVFECCNHNFDSALDALMEKADNGSTQVGDQSSYNTALQHVMDSSKQNQPLRLCVTESQCVDQNINTKTITSQIQKPTQQSPYIWNDQIRNIITNHNEGNRLLLLMRGLAGSGKTHLARQLVDIMIGSSALNYKTHIFSTDDFFMVHMWYNFDRLKLQDAHKWNQNRVKLALSQGLSPIIVDNTNIEKWEMEHYVRNGVANGYIIEVVEPDTPWAKNPKQLYMKNIHKVPFETIKRKLENYCEGITGNSLCRDFGLFYPANMVPPVKRLIPEVPQKLVNINNATEKYQQPLNNPNTSTNSATQSRNELDHSDNTDNLPNDDDNHETAYENALKENILLEAQKRLEDIEKVEQEWEHGEHWEEEGTSSVKSSDKIKTCLAPRTKPNYSIELKHNSDSNLMKLSGVNSYPDWSALSIILPEQFDHNHKHIVEQIPVQKASHSTSMECGDMDVDNGKYKVISTTSRDINEFYIPMHKEKIPEKRMLDQSSMTNQQDLLTRKRCKNEDKHFIAFRNLFKEISSSDLRDIFDKCDGDVNWAVDIVIGGKSDQQFKTVDTEEEFDLEEEGMGQEQCECLAAYGIVPDLGASSPSTSTASENLAVYTNSPMSTLQTKKKVKKNITVSANSKEMKKQIEQSVVIHDSHYSEHSLKIRKLRRNENNIQDEEASTSGTQIVYRHNENYTQDEEASTSGTLDTAQVLVCKSDDTNMKSYKSDDEESNASSDGNQEMVTINVGSTFISELDRLFGRTDMVYPDYIAPKISLPMSILNEINALWEESLTDQIEEKRKEINLMIKTDEKFARELAMEEQELVKTGKEPALPDFKEIMDMEVALQIYRKDVDKWRNNIPKDLAAKMTREKLFNLFQDIEKDTLSELLMAHDNNFQATVESLLMSTGQEQILEEENGVDKFIMMKELEHQQKILNEKRKVLSETEWPMLPLGADVEMSTVESYRKEAEKYLYYRNLTKNKAQEFSQRKIACHATYFSDLSSFYTQKYEQAASLAATALIQLSASKGASFTMDLHHLYVKEALEAMDLFIDGHIRKLKECQTEHALQKTTLFLITGRGLHSRAGPRIKPAVRKRLHARGLPCRQLNPGMFATEIRVESRLSYQLLLL